MYGGSGKLGRGGAGGVAGGGRGGKRNANSAFHPPPVRSSGGRLSIGGGSGSGGPRNRTTNSAITTSSAPSATEETFSLVTSNPLKFGVIVRLAPGFLEEIKRVESEGGVPRIKFDANGNNTSGNVIDLGGKDCRFTWAREAQDLCDIYEERESGEDGNGLLVESGCAWRKLNVHRVLDESTKNHVKMRSAEAEQKHRARKAIVLDHQNPSMKNQIKALAAAEINPWRNFKQKKETPLKKQKVEPSRVSIGGPPKSVYKPGVSSTPVKGRHSISPLPSPAQHSGGPSSPFGIGNLTKGYTSVEDVVPIQANKKDNLIGSEKELPGSVISETGAEKPSFKGSLGVKPADLQSMLISLLTEKPKGMSMKALEKAVGDVLPNSIKKIEPIIKKIATYQAPGRYFLKSGVELENYKKLSSESGSSPEDNNLPTPVPEDSRGPLPIPKEDLQENAIPNELEEPAELNSIYTEKIDILHQSPDLIDDIKVANPSEAPAAGSSSDSGSDSDSDSDSSDSGSDSGSHSNKSRSRSRSKSPVRSGSGSSSDSESDASTNSKEGSDEEVDIMSSDEEKETKHKLPQASEPGFPWRTPDGGPTKQDGHESDIDIEKDLPDDDRENEMAVVSVSHRNNQGGKPREDTKFSPPDRPKPHVYPSKLPSGSENIAKETEPDDSKHEQFVGSERISSKSKRVSDTRQFDENLERSKKSNAGNFARPQISQARDSFFSQSPQKLSPNGFIKDQMKNRVEREGNTDPSVQKVQKQGIPGKSAPVSPEPGQRSTGPSERVKATDMAEKASNHGNKYPGRNFTMHEGGPNQKDKVLTEVVQKDDGHPNEKKLSRNSKNVVPFESHHSKHGNLVPNLHISDNNRTNVDRSSSPVINGRGGNMLQRELSDLEMGELPPLPAEETPVAKKQFERKSSFKQSDNKPSASDYFNNTDLGKVKPAGRVAADTRKQLSPHLRVGVRSNSEEPIKKRKLEQHAEDLPRSHHGGQSQSQYLPRLDDTEVVGSQLSKLADASGKTRPREGGIGEAGYGDVHKKAPQQHDMKRGLVPHSAVETKIQKSGIQATVTDRRKDASLTESNDDVRKRRESSSDENSCSYSKYEKEEPELKGPIQDFHQYEEYVQEYREKYESYCSLNKILENYRNEFRKIGRDLEISRGRDSERYHNIVGQLNESYRQCGARHKRLKKIFVVLHKELEHMKQRVKDYAVSYNKRD